MTSIRLEMLTESNIEQCIKEATKTEFTEQVVQQLEQALTTIRDTVFQQVLMPNTPAITMRIDSIHIIFQALASVKGQDGISLLENIGKRVGKNFACSVEAFLEDNCFVASSPTVLLHVWSMLDKGANWGYFQPRVLPDKVIVSLVNSRLLAGDPSNVSPTLHFMGGYVFGVIWEMYKYHHRRLRETGMAPTSEVLEPMSVSSELERHEQGVFELALRKEQLEYTWDKVYKIRQLLRRDDLRKIGVEIRTVIESGLKTKIGAPIAEKMEILDLTKAYKKEAVDKRVEFRFDALEELYFLLNPDAHGELIMSIEEAAEKLAVVEQAMEELEILELGQSRKERILVKVRERHDKRQVSISSKVTAQRDAFVQINTGDGAQQSIVMEPEEGNIIALLEELERLRERLDLDDPTQAGAKAQIDTAIDECRSGKTSWLEICDRVSAIVRALASVERVREMVELLSELTRGHGSA